MMENHRRRKAQGAALRDWRERQKMTLRQVAKRCGVNVSTISRIENGQQSPGLELSFEIADMTGGVIPVNHWRQTGAAA